MADQEVNITEILENGVDITNFDEVICHMLRAVCKDEYVDVVEKFIKKFQEINWDEALTSDTQYERCMADYDRD